MSSTFISKAWKATGVILLLYVLSKGLLMDAPRVQILNETIRNLFFHVPMWFGMMLLLLASVVYSVMYLRTEKPAYDQMSHSLIEVSVLMGLMGITTGMLWAHYTWDWFWSNDPKQNAAAVGLLIYFAYFILRSSIKDEQQKAKVANVYSIFAFAIFIPLIWILPRLQDSLHPGQSGNPGFNAYDMDSTLRTVFYPAVIGWTLLGAWLVNIKYRLFKIEEKKNSY